MLCCAIAIGVLLFLRRPRVSREMGLAALPWLIAATPLYGLGGTLDYPSIVEPVLTVPWVFLLIGTLWAGTWLLLTQLVFGTRAHRQIVRYLALIGVGTALTPFGVMVLVSSAGAPIERVLMWAITPVLACVITYVLLISMWILIPRTAAFAGFNGVLLHFGLTLHAMIFALATIYGVVVPPPSVVDFLAVIAATLGVSETVVLIGATIWSPLLLSVVILIGFEALERWDPAFGRRGFDIVTIASVVSGSNFFVQALAGGVIL